jgi:hypothetical protein
MAHRGGIRQLNLVVANEGSHYTLHDSRCIEPSRTRHASRTPHLRVACASELAWLAKVLELVHPLLQLLQTLSLDMAESVELGGIWKKALVSRHGAQRCSKPIPMFSCVPSLSLKGSRAMRREFIDSVGVVRPDSLRKLSSNGRPFPVCSKCSHAPLSSSLRKGARYSGCRQISCTAEQIFVVTM